MRRAVLLPRINEEQDYKGFSDLQSRCFAVGEVKQLTLREICSFL